MSRRGEIERPAQQDQKLWVVLSRVDTATVANQILEFLLPKRPKSNLFQMKILFRLPCINQIDDAYRCVGLLDLRWQLPGQIDECFPKCCNAFVTKELQKPLQAVDKHELQQIEMALLDFRWISIDDIGKAFPEMVRRIGVRQRRFAEIS